MGAVALYGIHIPYDVTSAALAKSRLDLMQCFFCYLVI